MKQLLLSIPISLILLLLLFAFACKRSTGVEYNIDRSACNGCASCIRVCPHDAIYLDASGKAVIDQSKCQQCAKCVTACPNSAIY
ncbi:MAG: 4Fe-4S binding protein [Candidatus Cloacimonadaceae bacterium]|nr:4Fe-4S binding protein [Candidatus Cloacimonadaceae bacterium]